jgi:4,5-DOPA dioxygenase extradiol
MPNGMADKPLPVLFLSHGSPMLPFEEIPARHFMAGLGSRLPRPKAILCVSAHWETATPTVSTAGAPETIHDFHGFPEALYRLTYKAPGAPDLARRAVALLKAAGLPAGIDPARGLDHGAWNPLLLIYPQADIPVTQLSIQHPAGPGHHVAMGRALRPLRQEGVLILASGGAVHNLRQFGVDREKPAAWATRFDDWLADRVAAQDVAGLIEYRRLKPEGMQAHPRDEHFLPFFVALGAGEGEKGRPIHRSFAHGSLSMASYVWGDLAPDQARAA